MPSNMRHLFSKSKGPSAQSPDSGASVSSSAVCACGCLIHGEGTGNNTTMPVPEGVPASTPLATLTPSATPLATPASAAAVPLAASAPTPIEPHKPHPIRDNILKGASITLSVLEGVGAVAPVPFLKDIAKVTNTLVKLIQTVLQNNELLRELIQDAIALGRCIIDAVDACFTPGEPLPDVFEQQVRLLLDTLNEAKALCFEVLGKAKTKKFLDVNSIRDKTELRSNISVEAHFAKWSKFLEERFPLNGFVPSPPAPVHNISNVDNSQTNITNAPVNMNQFTCVGGIQSGMGNQINILPGARSSKGQQFDGLEVQKMILAQLNLQALPVRA